MLDALATAASGLRQAEQRLMSVAHDSASSSTADTVALRRVARQAPLGQGVRSQTQSRFEHRAELGADGRAVAPAIAAVGEQLASVQQARVQARVTRTADDMLGTLVDVVG